jgi:hypothetical protein
MPNARARRKRGAKVGGWLVAAPAASPHHRERIDQLDIKALT